MELGAPSLSLKVFLLRIAAVALIGGIILRGTFILPSKKILFAFLLFLTGSLVPVFYSGNFHTSFIGIYPFYAASGLTLLCLGVIFVVSAGLKKNEALFLIKIILVSALLVSIYGILQYAGIDFLAWCGNFYPRIWSTLGNPNFLAAYLAVLLPIGIYQYVRTGSIFYLSALLLNIVALFLTASRAGAVSAVVGVGFAVLILKRQSQFKKYLKLLALILIAVLIIFGTLNRSRISEIATRYISSFDIKESNVASRLNQWSTGVNMFLEKPLFGWGKNGYYIHFRRYMNEEFLKYTSDLSVPGYPHNYILQILVDGGIIFSLFIIFWWVVFFRYIYINRYKMEALTGVIGASFVAFFVGVMFSFNVVEVETIFWVLLGIAVASVGEVRKYDIRKDKVRYIFLIPLVLMVVFSINRLYADYLYHKGRYNKSSQLAPEIAKYRMSYGRKLFMEREYEEAEKVFTEQIKRTPFNALAYNGLASVYKKQGRTEEAIKHFVKAIELDPYLLDARLKLALIYRDLNKYDSAAAQYIAALKINEKLINPRYNLGVIYYIKGEYDNALREWEKVLEYNPDHKKSKESIQIIKKQQQLIYDKSHR